jgi:protein transport protein SEC23
MRGLSNSTGGHMILTDSFTSSMYKQSFVRIFNKDEHDNLLMAFNGETECGIGNTCSWKMCGIDPESSYGIYFEIAGQGGPNQMQAGPQKGMMQFLTYYQHSAGQFHLRGMWYYSH